MPNVHEGRMQIGDHRISIIAGRYNEFVTTSLVESAVECLVKHGADPAAIDVYWVPGAFEVPQMALRVGAERRADGIICLGAIIRGETNHFDILSASVIGSVAEVSSRCSIPVTWGIVTADTLQQATARAGGKVGNKGWESALALVEMMSLWEK
ncbi:MAG: 6,7-dimethyl-8-ribityllumazine synthase [Candidatus Krumholzibacteriia bacterium]